MGRVMGCITSVGRISAASLIVSISWTKISKIWSCKAVETLKVAVV